MQEAIFIILTLFILGIIIYLGWQNIKELNSL